MNKPQIIEKANWLVTHLETNRANSEAIFQDTKAELT